MENNETGDLRMIRVPSKFIPFMKSNPRAIKSVGAVLCAIIELDNRGEKEVAEKMREIALASKDGVKELLDTGTEKEFHEFLNHMLSLPKESIFGIDNVKTEHMSIVSNMLKEKGINSVISEFSSLI